MLGYHLKMGSRVQEVRSDARQTHSQAVCLSDDIREMDSRRIRKVEEAPLRPQEFESRRIDVLSYYYSLVHRIVAVSNNSLVPGCRRL